MSLFITAIALILFSGVAGIFCRKGSVCWERISLVAILAGCLAGLLAVGAALLHPEEATLFRQWPVPGGAFALKIDSISAVFLFPALLITAAGALYASGYWPVAEKPGSGAWLRFFYPLLAGGIMMLLVADNAILFLMAWEVMALAGYFLVVTEREDEEALKAGFIYLAATHTGTLALFGMFALLTTDNTGQLLPQAASLPGHSPQAAAVFLLALVGFGLKAGIIPMHIWLPRAHAAAPSNVSALMSGVMIKMGIYGIVRITGCFDAIPAWWGWTVLTLGMISAVFGVAFAIAQHDIKRLLAYHSVENIGIILLGLGTALLGRSYGVAAMVALGMAGALLHVVNHGLFKALLFLSAGSMIQATGTRLLGRYGGLLRTMPLTGLFFLGGAAAICGLPPLNGFVSEWLVYLGLFRASQNGSTQLALLALPGLAMTGGLALLCFAKVFGLSFSGMPRAGLEGREAPVSMLAPMAVLLAACLWIGLVPGSLLPLLGRATAEWLSPEHAGNTVLLAELAPAGGISLAAGLLLLLLAAFAIYQQRRRQNRVIPKMPTWGCGYALPIPRAQYTASSFAQMIVFFFGWALRTRTKESAPPGPFPPPQTYATHTPDGILDLILLPLADTVSRIAVRLRRMVQHGIVGIYLLYFAITLTALLLYSFWG